ncbi:TRAP transporter small permease [Aquincola tertiaricarbonis]|uniref:TRAP transporter small permease protein n=1 Tax=Aquincola tertiaricarbonis TaxID=391953 RepID=A0ABY4S165_AQUTE|nr:TRAP transporter small permease [Aquincola tertiaricarbonis]URI07148.1 TRAP transporter small permease [Aquincola tertiaricarbonis]
MKAKLELWLGTIFGLIFVALSLLVAVETVMRKTFNVSLQGADELGGYALAVGATIAFSLALTGRSHIRVDVFHDRLPAALQTALNWLSAVLLAGFAGLVAWLAWFVIQDSAAYKSVAQTPWATPLVLPQSVWLAGLVVFALVAAVYALRASWLLVQGRVGMLNREFGPRSTKDEVDEELEDLKARSGGEPAPAAPLTAMGVRP